MNKSIILLDLEATCFSIEDAANETINPIPRDESEIIEIGAVLYDDGEVLDSFTVFCKPVVHKELSKFCTKLTTITQSDVDSAPTLQEAIKLFDAWVEKQRKVYGVDQWGSWGFYDKNQFQRNRNLLKIKNLMSIERLRHKNISDIYKVKTNLKRKVGIAGALRQNGLDFEGVHHRAIYDAINIGRVLKKSGIEY